MKAKAIVAAALASACVVVGCVSIDSTRAQLASSNPQDVQKAEQNIFTIATHGQDATGLINFNTKQIVEYVNLVSNNALLLRIIDNAYYQDREVIITTAAAKIDFTKPGIGMEILKRRDTLSKVGGAEGAVRERMRERRYSAATPMCFADKVLATLNENELRQALGMSGIDDRMKSRLVLKLISVTTDPEILLSFYDGDRRNYIDDDTRKNAIVKLAGMSDKIHDDKVIIKILEASDRYDNCYIKDPGVRAKLLARLSEDAAVKYVVDEVGRHSVDSWNYNKMLPMDDAIAVTIEAAKKYSDFSAEI